MVMALMALAVVATVVLADVVFVYQGVINVSTTSPPLTFSTGPNAGPTNTAAAPYITFTGTNTGFTVSLTVTNSSAVYYYEAGNLTVNTAGYLYYNSATTGGTTSMVNTLIIYIQNPTTGANVCTFTVISNGAVQTGPSTSCPLSAGTTYYVSLKVVPNTPVTSGQTETITVNFGYNVISSTSVPAP